MKKFALILYALLKSMPIIKSQLLVCGAMQTTHLSGISQPKSAFQPNNLNKFTMFCSLIFKNAKLLKIFDI